MMLKIKAENAMTKRVTVSQKAKRAGEGGSPVRVEEGRRSLPSGRCEKLS